MNKRCHAWVRSLPQLLLTLLVLGLSTASADEPNAALAIAATAIVAVAFQPLRRRLEKVANRLVYGRRATPYEVLSEFSRRVAAT